jgi:hypothetical protein
MKFIINYLRECFCKHDWKTEEKECTIVTKNCFDDAIFSNKITRVSVTCTKCGYHKNYTKF